MSPIPLGILAAAGGGGLRAYDYLDSVTATGSQSTVTLTGLDSYTDYDDLELRISGQSTFYFQMKYGADIRVNGITSNDYYSINFRSAAAGAPDAQAQMAKGQWQVQQAFPSNSPVGTFGYYVLTLPSFLDTTQDIFQNGIFATFPNNNAPPELGNTGGRVATTGALSSMSFAMTSDNWSSGTKFDIFGIKAA